VLVDLGRITGFDWDEGNSFKNLDRHGVTQQEAEQVFNNAPLAIAPDIAHSDAESRFHAFGRTHSGRRLQVAFTLRDGDTKIRVVSARDMSRDERRRYEEGP
jgi:uncharacterized DUF497 family protein